MGTVVYIFIAILFFLYIIFMAILYIVIYNLLEKINKIIVKKYSKKYRRMLFRVLKDLSDDKGDYIINKNNINKIRKKLGNKYFCEFLNDTLYFYSINSPKNSEVPELMKNYDDHIEGIIYKYRGGKSIYDGRIIYNLGIYRVDKPFINNFLLKVLDNRSLNLKISSLTTLGLIGNEDYFLKGVKIISANETYIDKNVFIDIISDYASNRESLLKRLLDNFEEYSDNFKTIIIESFINYNYIKGNDKLLKMLKDNGTNTEIKLVIMRYFTRFRYDRAGEFILNLMEDEKFEIRLTAAKALVNYKSKKAIIKLFKALKDMNWYVRFNTANTLLDFNLGKDIIDIVEELNDKYALDIIYYTMFERNEINYDEYILRTRKGGVN